VNYAASLLDAVEASGAKVGKKPVLGMGGMQDVVPAAAWAAGARRDASLWTLLSGSKAELATKLTTTALGSPWLIDIGGKRVAMLDWLKEHHPETKELFK
jgi:hypothetical protein